MSVLTASVDDASDDYAMQPVNFGPRDEVGRIEAKDGFLAGAEWAVAHVDWRVLGGLVPGMVEARHVRMGDRVRLADGLSTVVGTRGNGRPGCVYVTARSDGGAEITHELRTSERVRIVAVKAVQP